MLFELLRSQSEIKIGRVERNSLCVWMGVIGKGREEVYVCVRVRARVCVCERENERTREREEALTYFYDHLSQSRPCPIFEKEFIFCD